MFDSGLRSMFVAHIHIAGDDKGGEGKCIQILTCLLIFKFMSIAVSCQVTAMQ